MGRVRRRRPYFGATMEVSPLPVGETLVHEGVREVRPSASNQQADCAYEPAPAGRSSTARSSRLYEPGNPSPKAQDDSTNRPTKSSVRALPPNKTQTTNTRVTPQHHPNKPPSMGVSGRLLRLGLFL